LGSSCGHFDGVLLRATVEVTASVSSIMVISWWRRRGRSGSGDHADPGATRRHDRVEEPVAHIVASLPPTSVS